jgi:glycosyltransferase 2 family protein
VNLKKIWTYIRIAVGLILIVFLLSRLDLHKVLQNLRGMDPRFLSLALVCYLFFIVVSAWRWQVLLEHKKIPMPFLRTNLVYFISLFFTNFLPTTVGGDVMRVVYSVRDKKADAVAVVMIDRILGFAGLFLFGLAAVLFLYIRQRRGEFLPLMIAGLLVIVAITAFLFSERAYRIVSPWVEKIKFLRAGERINNLHRTMNDFGGAWGPITLCVILSVLIQALLALSPFFVLRSMGDHHTGILPFLIYVPIINVICMIPVSLNGLGVRENSYALLFARAGLAGETSVTISLVAAFLAFLWSIRGGLIFIFYRKKRIQE